MQIESGITDRMSLEQNQRISEAVQRERGRLKNFIRKRVSDPQDAEDILQDVFFEFVQAYRLMKPVEQAGAWLYRVARNRITDLFRRKRVEALSDLVAGEAGDGLVLEEMLPSREAGPEAAFARSVLIEELEDALAELPGEQRQVFIAHELEGRTFKELAAESGLSVNTLLSRKHYAVRHLRQRLEAIYNEFQER